jgi:hypothetical protein
MHDSCCDFFFLPLQIEKKKSKEKGGANSTVLDLAYEAENIINVCTTEGLNKRPKGDGY